MISEQDSALIENFITKEDARMEFNEMQAIIKCFTKHIWRLKR